MQSNQQNYDPEQLVDRINTLVKQYDGPVSVKVTSSREDVIYSDHYNISITYEFRLKESEIQYKICKKNSLNVTHHLWEYINITIPSNENVVFTKSNSDLSDVEINGLKYREPSENTKYQKAKKIAERSYQLIKEYLQQEVPEILELTFKKPVLRGSGLDNLIKKLEVKLKEDDKYEKK